MYYSVSINYFICTGKFSKLEHTYEVVYASDENTAMKIAVGTVLLNTDKAIRLDDVSCEVLKELKKCHSENF